jgi:hypothetical protein
LEDFAGANSAEDVVNAADINSFVKRHLPSRLQKTFETLKHNDVKTTAKLLNKSCGAIYARIARIRVLMKDFKNEKGSNRDQ